MSLKPFSKDELIDVIVSNNMVEEFARWLKEKKGMDIDPISLKDVDYDLLLEFVKLRKLIDTETDIAEHYYEDTDELPIADDIVASRPTKPKKIRRKT
ncbi:hypothetical protein Igag_1580 [Ignisphaera aggregans DSM 17230]|uniref:Uncharacterized protein n=1 Tax=Ignisphaera aggregans (strain DSM 17230 / JCM 13409 / AQ1.S1) TaxID=583356 RepID=E0SRC8_IGNAA|nr:hypothetical protein Igag_1580 [Ignisphaera aggregans DSM 17230]